MKARLGTVLSNNVQMSRGLPPGALESPVIFAKIMELVLRDLIKSWKVRKLTWSLDDYALAAICYADDVVMVTEVIAKLKEVGLSVGAQKTHWTSHPKMIDRSIVVDGLAVMSKVCLDGNARYAIAHRSAQANTCLAKWRPVLSSSWLPKKLRLNIVKTKMYKETKLRAGVRERWRP